MNSNRRTFLGLLSAAGVAIATRLPHRNQGERVLQLLRLERADNFYRGIQNIAPTMDPSSGAISWTAYGPTRVAAHERNNAATGI